MRKIVALEDSFIRCLFDNDSNAHFAGFCKNVQSFLLYTENVSFYCKFNVCVLYIFLIF